MIVCEPQGTSLMMGGLHPRASLYERPVNLDAAKAAHAHFRRVMREAGVKVSLQGLSPARCRGRGQGPSLPDSSTLAAYVCEAVAR